MASQDTGRPTSGPVYIEDPRFSRWLFGSSAAAWIWLVARLWLGYEWLHAGWEKLQSPAWMDGGKALQGFVKGAYGAAIGTILGACVLLGRIAIGDVVTAAIALVSLARLCRWKVSNPLLIAAAGMVGLIAFPLIGPNWVMVR